MRLFLVGLICLCISASAAWGQVKATVESIGFQQTYRPDCWTRMVVVLTPETGENATYVIQVEQRDSDGDRVVYSAPVTVTGNREGQSNNDFRKEVYFLPKATRDAGMPFGGLADASDPGALRMLRDQLRVFVATEGGKQITQATITDAVQNLDPPTEPHAQTRGTKLVLAVADPDTNSQPNWREFDNLLGVTENVKMISLRPRELPENVLGYDAVDAVVFLNADPTELKTPTDERWRALQQWVREGGNLAVCQPPQWERTLQFGDMLPVTLPKFGTGDSAVQGVVDHPGPGPLYEIMAGGAGGQQGGEREAVVLGIGAAWQRNAKPPSRIALAEPKPGALVVRRVDWPAAAGQQPLRTPYIVRQSYGLGTVTWVAQDLGDRAVSAVSMGWPQVWDTVFGWNNLPYRENRELPEEREPTVQAFRPASGVDLGFSLLSGMEHGRKGAGLVFLVVFFFIAYWVVAGPVSYLFLAGKKRTHFSWFAFASAAGIATVLTAGVVELVLRGDAEVRHLSLVRLAADQPAVMRSRIGLYIPRDGAQEITMTGTTAGAASYITPFAYHPQHVKEQVRFTSVMRYDVGVPSVSDAEPPEVSIPYRSTLKKLQAKWVGPTKSDITGQVALKPGTTVSGVCMLDGRIVNGTPHRLRDVYLAYVDANGVDVVAYLPSIDSGKTIDLQNQQWHAVGGSQRQALPGQNKAIVDAMQLASGRHSQWLTEYMLSPSWRSMNEWNDGDRGYTHSLPVLSLYNRITPVQLTRQSGDRFEILRRNARHLDLSQVVAAGNLAVFGIADNTPLPMPFTVQGDDVPGEGTTIYQAVIPLDRSRIPDPTTQPSETAQPGGTEQPAPPPEAQQQQTAPKANSPMTAEQQQNLTPQQKDDLRRGRRPPALPVE